MQKYVCYQTEGDSIQLVSEKIISFIIFEDPQAHCLAKLSPGVATIISKSVLGSGVDLRWLSFDNVLERFLEDIRLLS